MKNVEQIAECRTKGSQKHAKKPTLTCWLCIYNHAVSGARSRNRTGTPVLEATDFKSVVSTYFTIRALLLMQGGSKLEAGART